MLDNNLSSNPRKYIGDLLEVLQSFDEVLHLQQASTIEGIDSVDYEENPRYKTPFLYNLF